MQFEIPALNGMSKELREIQRRVFETRVVAALFEAASQRRKLDSLRQQDHHAGTFEWLEQNFKGLPVRLRLLSDTVKMEVGSLTAAFTQMPAMAACLAHPELDAFKSRARAIALAFCLHNGVPFVIHNVDKLPLGTGIRLTLQYYRKLYYVEPASSLFGLLEHSWIAS